MSDKHYVIQWKPDSSRPWVTLDRKYSSQKEAEHIMEAKRKADLPCAKWRVAESYTVVRYKPVKG